MIEGKYGLLLNTEIGTSLVVDTEHQFSSNNVIKVVLADAQTLVRHGLGQAIAQQDDMMVVGETGDGNYVLELVDQLQPDIVILDVPLLRLSGTEVTQQIHQTNLQRPSHAVTNVIAFSAYGDRQYVWSLLSSGARGYLLKNDPVALVMDAVRQVNRGYVALSPSLQALLVDFVVSQDFTLSERELAIFKLLALGYSNKEIGQRLSISEKTVQQHLQNSYRKLPFVRNRSEAVSWAWINRLVGSSTK
jgi:DNA-binding NarL/FixJ family response regulator